MAEEKRPLIEVKNLKKYFQVEAERHSTQWMMSAFPWKKDRHWGLLERADVEKVPLVP